MDTLSGVLRSMRLKASIYCTLDMTAPWGLSLPKSATAPFHFIEAGACWLVTANGRRVRLEAGGLVGVFKFPGGLLRGAPGRPAATLRGGLSRPAPQGTGCPG